MLPLVVAIDGVGVRGPGLASWLASRATLAGACPYRPAPLHATAASLPLPANEARRLTATVRLALEAAFQALPCRGEPRTAIFACSSGNAEALSAIMAHLTLPSPTQFIQSVHGAALGYWSIATGDRSGGVSLAAGADSFSAGLLEACCQVAVEEKPALLVAYDVAFPPTLGGDGAMPPFAVALGLQPQAVEGLGRLTLTPLSPAQAAPPTTLADPALEALRRQNPAARSLPLLLALAQEEATTTVLTAPQGAGVTLHYCPHPRPDKSPSYDHR